MAIGSITVAGMRQVGCPRDFAAGATCNAGTLGIPIPPSIVMVVYVALSVGRMFLAGVIAGATAVQGMARQMLCALSDNAATMGEKSSALRLAPPTSAPSTLETAKISAALPGLTDPP